MRVEKLLQKIKQQGLDSFLVTNPINVSYFSGFKPSESYLLITSQKRIFITDFRYEEEVKKILKNWDIHITNGSLFRLVADLSNSLRFKKIGFEAKSLTFAEYEKFQKELSAIKLEPTYDIISSLRMIKEKQEIVLIKKAIEITLKGFDFAKKIIKPGETEKDIARQLEYFLKQQNADCVSFDTIVASGPNSSLPHAAISNRTIKQNDIVMVDMGISYKGYKSDLTRTFFLGKISSQFSCIYNILSNAQEKAIKAVKPGILISEIDKLSRACIANEGWARNFRHSLGHGIGLEVHEAPLINAKNNNKLEENMVFTIEPAIYLPGKFGVRIENMVLVTKTGCEVLSGVRNK